MRVFQLALREMNVRTKSHIFFLGGGGSGWQKCEMRGNRGGGGGSLEYKGVSKCK